MKHQRQRPGTPPLGVPPLAPLTVRPQHLNRHSAQAGSTHFTSSSWISHRINININQGARLGVPPLAPLKVQPQHIHSAGAQIHKLNHALRLRWRAARIRQRAARRGRLQRLLRGGRPLRVPAAGRILWAAGGVGQVLAGRQRVRPGLPGQGSGL